MACAPGRTDSGDSVLLSGSDTMTPIDAVFTEGAAEPPVRLVFRTPDPDAACARAIRAGGAGAHIGAMADSQSTPLAFELSPDAAGPPRRPATGDGALAATILYVRDTSLALGFYGDLFGLKFVPVGTSGNLWWIQGAPSIGVFPGPPEIRSIIYVPDGQAAVARVGDLGGQAGAIEAMGAYAVVGCRDGQDTPFWISWLDTDRSG